MIIVSKVAEKVQKVMTHGQYSPYIKNPLQNLLLRFGHSTKLDYTFMDEAHGFVKGTMMLFHSKLYYFFYSLPHLGGGLCFLPFNFVFIHTMWITLKNY